VRDHISLRVPGEWEGRINSAWVEECLRDYFSRRPLPLLPEDPGADGCRVSLSLPRKAVRVLAAALDQPLSASLRRLIAGYGSELPTSDLRALRAGNPLELEGSPVGALLFPQVQEALPPAPHGQRISRGEGGSLFVYEAGRWVQKWALPKEPRLLEMNTNSADVDVQPNFPWSRLCVFLLIFVGVFVGIMWLFPRGSAQQTWKVLAETRRFKTLKG